jgi:hypothetical protein
MTNRRSRRIARATPSGLKQGVFTSATLERTGRADHGHPYSYTFAKLRTDSDGNLVAEASCGDEMFVCKKEEIVEFAKFLNAIVEAGEAK